MHFHQKIHNYLLEYRKKYNSNFNFIVRQNTSVNDKKYPGGKIAHGLVFQGTENYCFVALVDKSGGANATKSVGIIIKPTKKNSFNAILDIVFPGEKDVDLINFYKTLASKFDGISWDKKGTRAYLQIGEFPENNPTLLYNWLDVNFPILRETALESGIENLIPNAERFYKLQKKLERKLLEASKQENYWIFQGNPKVFDFEAAIGDGSLDNFTVSSHKDKIKIGDKVIIWLAGDKAGCYALAEITSEPKKVSVSRDDKHWKVNDPNDTKAGIRITHNLFKNPILWDDIREYEELENFKGGNQGTNFLATNEEYNAIFNMISHQDPSYWIYSPGRNAEHWDEFYNEGIMAIGWDDLGDLSKYATKDEVYEALKKAYGGDGSKKNNLAANYEFCNQIKIGDVVIVKRGRGELLGYGQVSSDYYHDEKRVNYRSCRKVDWKLKGTWDTGHSLVLKTLTDITKYKEKKDHEFYYERLLSIMDSETENKSQILIESKNQILFGPPGTGKTYALKQNYFPLYTTKETSITAENNFETVVKGCSWWEVIAVALIQLGTSKVNDIYNHKWVQKKAELSNSKTVKPTLWGQLQSHTVESCEFVNVKSKQQPLIFNKTENSSWEVITEEIENQIPELYDLIEKVDNFKPDANKVIERFKFVTFHQSFSYEDFIEGIKPIMPENGEVAEDLGYKIEDGVFKEICKDAALDPDNRYAIFIDEINRGNVSAIFGELITLIETDKRTGTVNEMRITLPYSKKTFSVPSNLDIYGTMNTADRSVEALDTALRRRFEFKEMMPDLDVIKDEDVDGILLSDVLKTINERIELLIDRDHTIGHSYFVNVNTAQKLANAFNNKIVPLLQEYFYGDYGKIGLVLGKGFVDKVKNDSIEFASFDYENAEDFKTATFILKQADGASVIEAVKLLLGTAKIKEEE
ncbi:EVE domain-containing protein [Psychroserpens burtonensis]|uniref:EVE domain-containing protein n=1 Tax=Psychroserpens burtonensis TaxID=49278 RepID=A0A5C7B5L5_9FLAO|nr:AAA family ATPase [Psychroserpens burtonensis]TXE15709.1 EVE domain-containing protein [Psychroserpens burtonensis]